MVLQGIMGCHCSSRTSIALNTETRSLCLSGVSAISLPLPVEPADRLSPTFIAGGLICGGATSHDGWEWLMRRDPRRQATQVGTHAWVGCRHETSKRASTSDRQASNGEKRTTTETDCARNETVLIQRYLVRHYGRGRPAPRRQTCFGRPSVYGHLTRLVFNFAPKLRESCGRQERTMLSRP